MGQAGTESAVDTFEEEDLYSGRGLETASRLFRRLVVLWVTVAAIVALSLLIVQAMGLTVRLVRTDALEPEVSKDSVALIRVVDPATVAAGDRLILGMSLGGPMFQEVEAVTRDEDRVALRTSSGAVHELELSDVPPVGAMGVLAHEVPVVGGVLERVATLAGALTLLLVPVGLLVIDAGLRLAIRRRARRAQEQARAEVVVTLDLTTLDAPSEPNEEAAVDLTATGDTSSIDAEVGQAG